MAKECYQITNPQMQTPCFKYAGGQPCAADGCPVKDRIKYFKQLGTDINLAILLHSACRISSLSPDNHEYLLRMGFISKFNLRG